jgi:hypothetical protein
MHKEKIMNLASSLLFIAIALAFAYTFSKLLKKVYGALKQDPANGGSTGCNCCSGKCSHCSSCGNINLSKK